MEDWALQGHGKWVLLDLSRPLHPHLLPLPLLLAADRHLVGLPVAGLTAEVYRLICTERKKKDIEKSTQILNMYMYMYIYYMYKRKRIHTH